MFKERVAISLVYLAAQKFVLDGCHASWRRKRNKNVLKFVKNFWSAIVKREINFFWILLLEMSHGFIILTLKENDWAWNTGTLHLLTWKNSKQCRLPARFSWLFFGTHKELTWQNFWRQGRLSIQLSTLKQ